MISLDDQDLSEDKTMRQLSKLQRFPLNQTYSLFLFYDYVAVFYSFTLQADDDDVSLNDEEESEMETTDSSNDSDTEASDIDDNFRIGLITKEDVVEQTVITCAE